MIPGLSSETVSRAEIIGPDGTKVRYPPVTKPVIFLPSRLSLLPQRDLTLLGTFTITP
jgi:hypothetical protein